MARKDNVKGKDRQGLFSYKVRLREEFYLTKIEEATNKNVGKERETGNVFGINWGCLENMNFYTICNCYLLTKKT
jgi:hypothetical protein